MFTQSDLIHLPFTPDLTQAGIAYYCRSLSRLHSRSSSSKRHLVHNSIADKAVELALRRYMVSQEIPHGNLCATPFSDPDQHDILLGGHRYQIKSIHIFERNVIRNLRKDPGCLLRWPAVISVDELWDEFFDESIIYIFTISTALVTANRTDLERAQSCGQPLYWMHIPSKEWHSSHKHTSFCKISLKSEATKPIHIELGGYNSNLKFHSEHISLPPLCRVEIQTDFCSLSYLHAEPIPNGRIGLHSPNVAAPYIISPHRWDNIWVYGMSIILAGYILRREIKRSTIYSSNLPTPLSKTSNRHTSIDSRTMLYPMAKLSPITDLFKRTKGWSNEYTA